MRKLLFTIIAGWIALGASGCEDSRPVGRPRPMPPAKPRAAPQAQPSTQKSTLPKAEQRLCTAVVILLDMSSSMSQDVKGRDGQMQPKSVIAREALERTIAYTERWKSHHADQSLCLGLFSFSSSVKQILPTSEFDSYTAKWALKSLGPPSTGTAIGLALEEGFKDLYKSGCVRKHILCITDGFNSSGPPPDRIARSYYAETQGEVEIHFVAFDVSGRQFDFLKSVNGHVVEAADGNELESKLYEIYDKRIFAEAMPAEDEFK